MRWIIVIGFALFAVFLIILIVADMKKREAAYRQEASEKEAYEERWSEWGDMTKVGP